MNGVVIVSNFRRTPSLSDETLASDSAGFVNPGHHLIKAGSAHNFSVSAKGHRENWLVPLLIRPKPGVDRTVEHVVSNSGGSHKNVRRTYTQKVCKTSNRSPIKILKDPKGAVLILHHDLLKAPGAPLGVSRRHHLHGADKKNNLFRSQASEITLSKMELKIAV